MTEKSRYLVALAERIAAEYVAQTQPRATGEHYLRFFPLWLAMESSVAETVSLVETHMPEVDTAPARRLLGERHQPWHMPTEPPAPSTRPQPASAIK